MDFLALATRNIFLANAMIQAITVHHCALKKSTRGPADEDNLAFQVPLTH
jgi:hypothetical protein